MKIKLLVTLATILLSTSTMAQPIRTYGAVDCGEWIARKENKVKEFGTISWVTGFMTGLNFDGRGKDLLRKVSPEQIYLWLDNYCKANPLSTTVTGGQLLMDELEKK